MFWGLAVAPQKEFTRVVDLGFTVTGAAAVGRAGRSTVFIRTENTTFALVRPPLYLSLSLPLSLSLCFSGSRGMRCCD